MLSRLGYHRRTGISARSCPGVAPCGSPRAIACGLGSPLLMNGHHAKSHALAAVRQELAISTELHTFRQIHKYGQYNQVLLWRFGHCPTFTARPDLFGY